MNLPVTGATGVQAKLTRCGKIRHLVFIVCTYSSLQNAITNLPNTDNPISTSVGNVTRSTPSGTVFRNGLCYIGTDKYFSAAYAFDNSLGCSPTDLVGGSITWFVE